MEAYGRSPGFAAQAAAFFLQQGLDWLSVQTVLQEPMLPAGWLQQGAYFRAYEGLVFVRRFHVDVDRSNAGYFRYQAER